MEVEVRLRFRAMLDSGTATLYAGRMRSLIKAHLAAWIAATSTAFAADQVVESSRPKHFPHRIWAACDFEGQTPDYGWFGKPERKNIPEYPGNATALRAEPGPYQNFSA